MKCSPFLRERSQCGVATKVKWGGKIVLLWGKLQLICPGCTCWKISVPDWKYEFRQKHFVLRAMLAHTEACRVSAGISSLKSSLKSRMTFFCLSSLKYFAVISQNCMMWIRPRRLIWVEIYFQSLFLGYVCFCGFFGLSSTLIHWGIPNPRTELMVGKGIKKHFYMTEKLGLMQGVPSHGRGMELGGLWRRFQPSTILVF